jgi:predicted nucleotidyltransferase
MKDGTEERKAILTKELKRVVDIVIKEYLPEKIVLFGSLSDGEVHEWSDIDLVIIKDTPKRFLDRIEEVLFLVYPKVGLNVVVYTPLEAEEMENRRHYFFVDEIMKKGKVLYERDKQLV